jgi:cation:H+ antiporter
MLTAFQIVTGFVLLIVGAEVLVRGAVRLAALLGMTPLVIGLTVVAFGTSAPELAVSVVDVYTASGGDLAVGNAVGSNTLNVLLILGMSALVVPLRVQPQVIRLDVPVMIAATLALLLIVQDGGISRPEGMVMFSTLVAYIVVLIRLARKQTRKQRELARQEAAAAREEAESEDPEMPGQATLSRDRQSSGVTLFLKQSGLVVGGLMTLAIGCQLFVMGATSLALTMGVSELLVGLTVVSIGTSLPELVTSVIAGARGERDLAVGNIVGSNLFNILCVLGLTASVAPSTVPVAESAIFFDIPITLAVAVMCLPVFFTKMEISRWEGALMLVLYGAYLTWRIMNELALPAEEPFTRLLWFGLFPVTLLLLAGSVMLSLKRADPRD